MEQKEESKLVVIEGNRKRDLQSMSQYQDVPADNSPMAMLAMAVRQGADLDKIAKLMDLQERHEANEARKAFTAALAGFKAAGITVGKDKQVSYTGTAYTHASLGNVCKTIGDELSKHGLSATWKTEQVGSNVKVTCILSHIAGHSESVSLEAGPDDSGKKNRIQQIASTVSYLERYTLLAITGTATADMDDDGRAGFTAADVMDEGQLCDYLAAIEVATTRKALGEAYQPAIKESALLGDKEAAKRLDDAKQAAFIRIEKSAKP